MHVQQYLRYCTLQKIGNNFLVTLIPLLHLRILKNFLRHINIFYQNNNFTIKNIMEN